MSNRWILLAGGILLVATLAVSFSSEWFAYQDGQFTEKVSAAVGEESPAYEGATFEVLDVEIITGGTAEAGEIDLGEGLSLVRAILRVTPTGDEGPSGCNFVLDGTSPEESRTRTWSGLGEVKLSIPFESGGPTDYCDSEETEPYRLLVDTVIPTGAASASAALRLELFGSAPRYLELELAPLDG